MGVPASEVGYTIATTRRETTKVHKNMWWHGGGEFESCYVNFRDVYNATKWGKVFIKLAGKAAK